MMILAVCQIRRMLVQLIGPLAWASMLLNPTTIVHALATNLPTASAHIYVLALMREACSLAEWLNETTRVVQLDYSWGLPNQTTSVDEKNSRQTLKRTAREGFQKTSVLSQMKSMLNITASSFLAVTPFLTVVASNLCRATAAFTPDILETLVVGRCFTYCFTQKNTLNHTPCPYLCVGNDVYLVFNVFHLIYEHTRSLDDEAALQTVRSAWTRFHNHIKKADDP